MNKRKNRRSRCYRPGFNAFAERLERRVVLTGLTFMVTSNADSGENTLRFAIASANQHPGSLIEFDIKQGAPTINLLSPLPGITAPVTIDGTSQPGYVNTPIVTVNGSGIGSNGTGLDFFGGSDGSEVEGLEVTGFAGAAILVFGAFNVTIGGPDAGDGNVISGNPGDGIALTGTTSTNSDGLTSVFNTANTVIEGNEIGTDPTGTAADANGVGISIDGATDNTVGGTTATVRNIISGNTTDGIDITQTMASSPTSGNSIEGNYIGTNAAGIGTLPNGNDGINISGGATTNTIGGSAGQMNLISGNTSAGVAITGAGTSGNVIAGNEIGTAAGEPACCPTRPAWSSAREPPSNTVGGSAGQMNLISGNTGAGVAITGAGTSGNTIAGNEIGTAAGGTSVLPNATGVDISQGATSNTIGGSAGQMNLISGNTGAGVAITGAGTSENTVAGNEIGTAAGGTSVLPNAIGVVISQGANNNTIGGATPGDRNVISGNTGDGIDIDGSSGIAVIGNFIGIAQNGKRRRGQWHRRRSQRRSDVQHDRRHGRRRPQRDFR